jgi:hypothetical protein
MAIDSGAVVGAACCEALDCLRGIAELYQFDRIGRGLVRYDACIPACVRIMAAALAGPKWTGLCDRPIKLTPRRHLQYTAAEDFSCELAFSL